jgi:DNA helicase-2/ATP-dependent DNA helicase PcrA
LLLDGWRLPTSALTLVAFNKRAATEMAERTADLPRLHIRTLNALAYAIVNGAAPFARQSVRRSVIDEREVRRILDTLVTFPRRANTDPAAAWIEALASVRLGLRRPSDVEAEFDGDVEGLVEVVGRYRALLAERNVVDFDEQIVAAIELLLRSPEARAAAQRACRVLLIDEFQDLAPAHLLLVRLLASPDLAIFAVGDDDQTIYGYAGATPRWLVGFSDLVAGAGDHPLTVNYRCPPAVVNAASTLLSHNITRVAKTISPAPGRAPEPRDLEIVQGDPVALTVEAVQEALRTGAPASSIAVLARVTASLAPVQIALSHHGVPVRAAVDEQWLERGGMASALAWLRLANDPEQLRSVDVVAAARRPPRSIAPKVLQWMGEQTSVTGLRRLGSRLNGRDSERVIGFADDLDRVVSTGRSGDTLAMLRVVRDSIGLDGAIATLDGARRRLDRSAQIDDLDALVALASLHPDPSTFERWLRTSLRRPGDPDGVALNTIHAVKGREWPTVIVHDVTAGLLPHRLADDLEEERRVFHVAITRARQRTVVVASATAPSRFIHELSVARDPNAAVPTEEPRRRLPAPPPRIAEVVLNESGQQRAEALRTWRSSRARQDKVPAYVVFSNLTLDAIAAAAPATLAELARISGVGPTKLERYGDEVLAALAETA